MNRLHRYLAQGPSAPAGLPLVHVTPLSRLRHIAATGRLVPQTCPVFRRDILYCSYGDVVFRPSREDACWDVDPAVALILSPRLLERRFTFAPLDTGAIASGRVPWFPNDARSSLSSNYCVSDVGARRLGAWVGHLFGGDVGYVNRSVMPATGGEPDELLICRRLAEAVSDTRSLDHSGNDMRVISQVECQFSTVIELDRFLLAAYLPSEAFHSAGKRMRPSAVQTYSGQSAAGNLPAELVALVRQRIAMGLPENVR